MERENTQSPLIVLAVGIALLTVAMPALAAHNSVGGQAGVAVADEVTDTGELVPDIPRGHPMEAVFADHLEIPRLQPADQTGDRYTDCQKAGDVDSATYLADLKDGDSCYIGFMDAQFEYLYATNLFLGRQGSDPLYPVNPAPDDEFCQDLQNRDSPECAGDGHEWFQVGLSAIDTDLLDEPFMGQNGENSGSMGPGLTDVTGTDPGSGTLTLPLLETPYLFLFGQPHPDNPNPSEFEAGSGPFGPNPAEGGSPLFDLTGACGERTLECKLLTPEDIVAYDQNSGNLGDVEGQGERARVCDFRPQFVTINPDDRAAGLCGVFGDVYNQFLDDTTHGGLGFPGAPPTWVNTQPGWYEGVLMIIGGEPLTLGRYTNEYQCLVGIPFVWSANDCDGEYLDDILQYSAVNPLVPTETHALWCVRPNFLATGGTFQGLSDPGFYGTYIADGIDSDVYRISALHEPYQEIKDEAYAPVRGVLEPVEAAFDSTGETVEQVTEEAELPPDVEEVLNDAGDRADFFEANDPLNHVQPWSSTRDAGIGCDAFGVPQVFEDPLTQDGDTIFNTEITVTQVSAAGVAATTSLKDPTLFTDGLPAGESETTEGAWLVNEYSFGGQVRAFLDTSQDAVHGDGEAEFSGCASANGQPQPNNDFCTWEALWDAYNPECDDIEGNPCEDLLKGMGYDLEAGVGLHFVWKVSGPVVVVDEDATANTPPRANEITSRSAVLGLNDPTSQNCIVGFSIGLADVIDSGAIAEAACADSDGETFVIEDAFDDQSGVNRGGFSAAIDLYKLTPTPSAVTEASGLGAGDELCVTGLWNVVDGEVADDTAENIKLTGRTVFSDCHPMESTIKA